MNLKALVGGAVAFAAAAYVVNTYFYLPVSAANPAPGTALLPLWASLLLTGLACVACLHWANQKIQHPIQAALILAVAQILLVDFYYVLEGTRSLTAAGASAVTLLADWTAAGFVYGTLSRSA